MQTMQAGTAKNKQQHLAETRYAFGGYNSGLLRKSQQHVNKSQASDMNTSNVLLGLEASQMDPSIML